jgi:hypothetical protein
MIQAHLDFTPPPAPVPPVRDQRVPARELPRLKGMSLRILERLREGPATNAELASMFRFSNITRMLENRNMGTVKSEDLGGGLWVYRLVEEVKG